LTVHYQKTINRGKTLRDETGETRRRGDGEMFSVSPRHPVSVSPSRLFVAAFGFETKVSQLAERGHTAARL
jgi:hypothetical protein